MISHTACQESHYNEFNACLRLTPPLSFHPHSTWLSPSFTSRSHCLLLLICFKLISFSHLSVLTIHTPTSLILHSWTTRAMSGFTTHWDIQSMFLAGGVTYIIGTFSTLSFSIQTDLLLSCIFSSLFLCPLKIISLHVSNSWSLSILSTLQPRAPNKLSTASSVLSSRSLTLFAHSTAYRKFLILSIYNCTDVSLNSMMNWLGSKSSSASKCFWAAVLQNSTSCTVLTQPRWRSLQGLYVYVYFVELRSVTWAEVTVQIK